MSDELFHLLIPAIAGAGHAGHRYHSHSPDTADGLSLGRMARILIDAKAVPAIANDRDFQIKSGNGSTNGSGSQSTAGLQPSGIALENTPDWYLRYSSIYVVPVVIILGVVNNAFVLWVMPNARVSVPPRVKRLYILIAFFDLIAVVVKDLLYYYIEDGLYYTTNGAFWV